MSYRTILVHMNDARRARRLLSHAAELARAFEAHLLGLHAFPAPRLKPPIPLPVGTDVLGGLKWSIDEETQHLRSIFEELTTKQRFVGEWRSVTSERGDPAKIVIARAHAADLVIASQADPQWDFSVMLDFPGRLAIESGRPVLVVPNEGQVAALPSTVVIAWNQRREAARAVFDALPLLKGAKKVELLTIDDGSVPGEGSLEPKEAFLPASAVADALLRHGVRTTVSVLKATSNGAGQTICQHAAELKAELLVMGAYGHTRLHEFVFGGATRYVLKNMTIPVFFSH